MKLKNNKLERRDSGNNQQAFCLILKLFLTPAFEIAITFAEIF